MVLVGLTAGWQRIALATLCAIRAPGLTETPEWSFRAKKRTQDNVSPKASIVASWHAAQSFSFLNGCMADVAVQAHVGFHFLFLCSSMGLSAGQFVQASLCEQIL